MRTTKDVISRWKTTAYFAALLIALIIIFFPSFRNPPRSDWWSALYSFHLVDASPGPPGFSFIVNHDPWRDGTFRPLAHPLLYLEHRLFGANFVLYHLSNLLLYFLSIILLYGLGRQLRISRTVLAGFLFLFAFLFSHFDIVTWTFHVGLSLSFSSFLLGLIIYFRYLKEGNGWNLLPVGCLFLFSMLCSELYLFWPLGLLLPIDEGLNRRRSRGPTAALMAGVYAAYLGFFMVTRTSVHTSGSFPWPTAGEFFQSGGAVFFNLLYNGLLVNLLPFLALPLRITHNIEMGGAVTTWSPGTLRTIVLLVGAASILLIGVFFLRRPRRRRLPSAGWWLAFFYGSSFFVLALGRSMTENFNELFLQFRYQYIPNALLMLGGALFIDRLVKTRVVKRGVCFLLIGAAVLNLILVRESVTAIGEELAPLGRLLGRIRQGIEIGEITPQRPLAIPDGIPAYLPSLCWNKHMGRFFRGTYQWIFSREEILCFTPYILDAAWVVDGERLNYRPKQPGDPSSLPQRQFLLKYRDRAGSLDPDMP